MFRDLLTQIYNAFLWSLFQIESWGNFTLLFTDDLTYKQIAEKYNVTPRKVKREISKVLRSIRDVLKDYLPALVVIYPGLMN